MENEKIKFGAVAVVLVIVGLAAGYVLGVIGYLKVIGPYVSEMKYKAFLEDYLKPYQEDFVGGDTPEQTMDLFIEALKKEDYELASKYFVINKQKEAYNKLIVEKVQVSKIVDEIEFAKNNWHKKVYSEDSIQLWYNKEGIKISRDIGLSKNVNNKWKIDSINIYYLGF